MILRTRIWVLLGFVLMLAACGGGNSSQIVTPGIVLVTPSSTTIIAGTTLQLNATVTNSNNTTVLWFVDNIPGGNSTVGTITPQGLYTAPNLPPGFGGVVISASPQAFPSINTSITIGITFGTSSLNGNYVFALSGTQGGSPWAVVGSFTGSNGTINNGVEDINGSSGVFQALPFTGSYVINADGQGTATFTSSQGSVSLAFTVNRQGQAVAIRTSGGVASGNFYPQLSSGLGLTNLNAPYVFSFTGSDSSGKTLNLIGTFVTNGSAALTYAEEDINDGGTTANQPFSGSIGAISNGRGTATFTDSTDTRSYSFYVVSPLQLQFIETDASGHLSGTVFQQQGLASSTTLVGSYVFDVAGSNGSAAYGAAGGFVTNTTTADNINAGTGDINNAGSIATNATLTGDFTTGAAGRGTLSLSGASGTNHYVYYLITPSAAFMLSTDPSVNASGQLFAQTGGFATASLNGNYTLLLASPVNFAPPSSTIGLLDLNGSGSIAGSQTVNINGTISGAVAVTGTYVITASTSTTSTRGVATLSTAGGASINFAVYPISNSSVILLGESGTPVVGTMVSQ